jgi:protein-disulfide isomerase/uncharacterized membrane protein
MTNARRGGAIVLLLVAAALAAALLLKHYGVGTPADAICGAGTSGCDVVNQSGYAKVLGVPLAAIGLVFYLALSSGLALSLFAGDAVRAATARGALGLLALALVVDLVLLGVQALELERYCALCVTTYVLGAAAFALLLPARGAPLAPLAAGEGRLVSAGAAIAALSTAVAAATFQQALKDRPAGPALFGAAAPAASPAGASADTQQEARRLQAILDDPQKLERYYTDKAVKEFEQAKVESFDLASATAKGAADAPIKIVEFSDFLCPFCKQLADWLNAAALPQLGARAAVHYKQYPMDTSCNPTLKQQLHPGACEIARGGICAAEQNRFWPYHDMVFSRFGQLKTRADAQRAAADAGLDAAAFGACMGRPDSAERLKAQLREGAAAGVSGTPTVFLNGKRATNLNYLTPLIEKELQRLGLPPLQPPKPPAHQ